ncbi:hypothetical protein [Tabrizicola thermarum]|uniref:hypothetical protein n=1 Tax=Tabrizicola thermarum TaxID=2670345 RepID=UPI000FFC6A8D|nr:hypothetical protein [Tabrizicola thermarum]
MRAKLLVLVSAAVITACGPNIYQKADPGEFSGRIFLMWIDDGGALGSGTFVFVPVPGQELTFTRKNPAATVRSIRPEMMYTDGGSIPRIAQAFKGFSPWGYAPAYMVHDWLFIARNCNKDGTPTDRERDIAGMKFAESADVMAEAIKALVAQNMVRKNDVSEAIIPSVVAGPITRALWEKDGACAGRRVSEADRLAVEAGLPGRRVSLRGATRTLPDGRIVPVKPARLIETIGF